MTAHPRPRCAVIDKRCSSCAYYDGVGVGAHCVRRAPVVFMPQGSHGYTVTEWPKVSPLERCGEWEFDLRGLGGE